MRALKVILTAADGRRMRDRRRSLPVCSRLLISKSSDRRRIRGGMTRFLCNLFFFFPSSRYQLGQRRLGWVSPDSACRSEWTLTRGDFEKIKVFGGGGGESDDFGNQIARPKGQYLIDSFFCASRRQNRDKALFVFWISSFLEIEPWADQQRLVSPATAWLFKENDGFFFLLFAASAKQFFSHSLIARAWFFGRSRSSHRDKKSVIYAPRSIDRPSKITRSLPADRSARFS